MRLHIKQNNVHGHGLFNTKESSFVHSLLDLLSFLTLVFLTMIKLICKCRALKPRGEVQLVNWYMLGPALGLTWETVALIKSANVSCVQEDSRGVPTEDSFQTSFNNKTEL